MKLKYRTVLFDLDDTLLDHQPMRRNALDAIRQALLPEDIDVLALARAHDRHLNRTNQLVLAGALSPEQARTEWMKGTLSDFDVSVAPQRLLELEEIYQAAYDCEWSAVPGAIE